MLVLNPLFASFAHTIVPRRQQTHHVAAGTRRARHQQPFTVQTTIKHNNKCLLHREASAVVCCWDSWSEIHTDASDSHFCSFAQRVSIAVICNELLDRSAIEILLCCKKFMSTCIEWSEFRPLPMVLLGLAFYSLDYVFVCFYLHEPE